LCEMSNTIRDGGMCGWEDTMWFGEILFGMEEQCERFVDTACDAMRDGRIQCFMEEYSEGWRDLVWDGAMQCGMNESWRYGGIK
jgi:hypothetical protein